MGAVFTLRSHVVSPSLRSNQSSHLLWPACRDGQQVREDSAAKQLLCICQADAHQRQCRLLLLSRLRHLHGPTYLPEASSQR